MMIVCDGDIKLRDQLIVAIVGGLVSNRFNYDNKLIAKMALSLANEVMNQRYTMLTNEGNLI